MISKQKTKTKLNQNYFQNQQTTINLNFKHFNKTPIIERNGSKKGEVGEGGRV